MGELYQFTKAQLTKAFEAWNKDVKEHPENFQNTGSIEEDSSGQAEALINYLSINKKS